MWIFVWKIRVKKSMYMGDKSYSAAIKDKSLNLVGPSVLTRNINNWLSDSIFSGIRPANEI
jgi:hypothetical protein